jgi:hypothetical protein
MLNNKNTDAAVPSDSTQEPTAKPRATHTTDNEQHNILGREHSCLVQEARVTLLCSTHALLQLVSIDKIHKRIQLFCKHTNISDYVN